MSPAEDGYIVYQPDQQRVHFLNASAALVLELCNGRNSEEDIIHLLHDAYKLPEPPAEAVRTAINQLKAEGLLL